MMIDPNAPAYPAHYNGTKTPGTGLTIRAEIASRIMAGLAADPRFCEEESDNIGAARGDAPAVAAIIAVEWDDALIAELNKGAS